MKTKLHIKQSIQSQFANVQTKVPGEIMAVSCSFQPQQEENTFKNNNLQLSKVPSLSKTNFIFNDATNSLVSYEIKNNIELVGRFIDSFMDTGRNSLSTQKLANNNGFGLGLDLGQVIDGSTIKIFYTAYIRHRRISPIHNIYVFPLLRGGLIVYYINFFI